MDSSDGFAPASGETSTLLSLPLELFFMICGYITPIDTPTYNRYHLLEHEPKFHGRQITQNIVRLAVTSRSAFEQCAAACSSTGLKVSIGWNEYGQNASLGSDDDESLEEEEEDEMEDIYLKLQSRLNHRVQ